MKEEVTFQYARRRKICIGVANPFRTKYMLVDGTYQHALLGTYTHFQGKIMKIVRIPTKHHDMYVGMGTAEYENNGSSNYIRPEKIETAVPNPAHEILICNYVRKRLTHTKYIVGEEGTWIE